jgi:hypothetical protein
VHAAAPELRPLGIGEVLDVGIKIVWRNVATMLWIVVPILLPVQFLASLISISAEDTQLETVDPVTGEVTYNADDVWVYATALIAVAVIGLLASTLITAACFKAVGDAYLGERPTAKSSLAYALRRTHSIIWVTFLSWLLILIGFVLCILPGIWLYVAFALAVPALLTEGVKGRKALGRSRRLIQGRWWPAFAIILLGTLLTSIVAGVVAGLLEAASLTDADNRTVSILTTTVGDTIAAAVTTPFSAAFVTVLYFDLRVRKEGFDLQLFAERLGLAPRPAGEYRPPPAATEAPAPSGEQPPYWPPPPGWQPSGQAEQQQAEGEKPSQADQPPYWPPPPGWQPSGSQAQEQQPEGEEPPQTDLPPGSQPPR